MKFTCKIHRGLLVHAITGAQLRAATAAEVEAAALSIRGRIKVSLSSEEQSVVADAFDADEVSA